jgi:hypothetical protein
MNAFQVSRDSLRTKTSLEAVRGMFKLAKNKEKLAPITRAYPCFGDTPFNLPNIFLTHN